MRCSVDISSGTLRICVGLLCWVDVGSIVHVVTNNFNYGTNRMEFEHFWLKAVVFSNSRLPP